MLSLHFKRFTRRWSINYVLNMSPLATSRKRLLSWLAA